MISILSPAAGTFLKTVGARLRRISNNAIDIPFGSLVGKAEPWVHHSFHDYLTFETSGGAGDRYRNWCIPAPGV